MATSTAFETQDPELRAVYKQALSIGEHSREEHIYSFSSLFLAVYYCNGATCDWWRQYVRNSGIRIEAILSELGVKEGDILEPRPVEFSKQRVTISAQGILEQAEALRASTGSGILGVRHLLASYIFRMPDNHRVQAQSWNFNASDAVPSFLDFMKRAYPEEAVAWQQTARQAFDQTSSLAASVQPPKKMGVEENVPRREIRTNISSPDNLSTDEQVGEQQLRKTTADYTGTEGLQWVLSLAQEIRISDDPSIATPPRITSRSVFFALVDFGAMGPGTTAGHALWKAILSSKALQGRYKTLRRSYSRKEIDVAAGSLALAPAPISRNLDKILQRALALAQATTGRTVIGLRHLTAALLMEGPNLPGHRLSKTLETLALDTSSFLYRMYLDLKKNLPDENMAAWEQMLFASGPRDIPEYSADDDAGPDLLNIRDDVEAFASIIASRDLHPPVSVGLFGDWGSGKSFFMRMLRERVDGIAQFAARDNSKVFCSQIVQIPFNAWFYMDHNLWATLVSEIFDKLFVAIHGGPLRPEEAKKQIQKRLEEAEGLFKEARKELDEAQHALAQAQQRLKTLTKARQEKEQTLSESINDIGSLLAENTIVKQQLDDVRCQLGLPEATRSFQYLEEQLGQARSLGHRMATIAMAVFQPPRVVLRILALGAVFVVPVIVADVVSKISVTKDFRDLAVLLAGAGSFATTASVWIARQIRRGSEILGKAESVFEQLKAIREKKIRKDTAPQRAELQQLEEKEAAARKQVADTEIRVQTLQRELEELQPGVRLQKFIRERSASTDYSKHLGLVSLIRKDFQTLSDLIQSREDIPVQRIVLYIDDLDRCPPNRVVEVLEAIHLLLAFSLFVVIVGVDARWIVRSLQRKYRGLLTQIPDGANSNDVATPHDYLEKIFQIPFWIHPMTKEASLGMVTGLLPIQAVNPRQDMKPDSDAKTHLQPDNSSAHPERGGGHTTVPSGVRDGGNDRSKSLNEEPAALVPQTKSADPGKLILKEFELEFIQNLAPYIGRSPRRVKRFVNTYRLLRASIRPGADAVNFLGTKENPGEHRVALVLLALLTGSPTLAPEILRALRDTPPGTSISTFRERISTDFAGTDSGELNSIADVLQFFSAIAKDKTLVHLKQWEPVVARYSFRPREVAPFPAAVSAVRINGTRTSSDQKGEKAQPKTSSTTRRSAVRES